MRKHLEWLRLISVFVLGVSLRAEDATPRPEPLRVTLTLSDGSKVIGEPALTALPLKTDYSKMEISLAKISSLKFSPDATNAVVTLVNGDKLSAVPGITELRLATLFGKVSIPLKLVTSLTVSSGGVSAVPREGLVLWFPFDSIQGPEVTDASERGHIGKLSHGARIVADEGRRRDVLELDGNGAHIRVPGSPDFALTNATVCVWLKPDSWDVPDNAAQTVFSTGTPIGRNSALLFGINPRRRVAWEYWTVNDRHISENAPLTFDAATDQWHFLAITLDYQDGRYRMRAYQNGKLLSEASASSEVMAYSGQKLFVGISYDSAAADMGMNYPRQFKGRMDNLMLFNRALNAEEIAALYNAQK